MKMFIQTMMFPTRGSAQLVVLFSLLVSVTLTSSTRETLVRLTSALQVLEDMMEDQMGCGRCGACRYSNTLEDLRRDVRILVDRRVSRRDILRSVVWELYAQDAFLDSPRELFLNHHIPTEAGRRPSYLSDPYPERNSYKTGQSNPQPLRNVEGNSRRCPTVALDSSQEMLPPLSPPIDRQPKPEVLNTATFTPQRPSLLERLRPTIRTPNLDESEKIIDRFSFQNPRGSSLNLNKSNTTDTEESTTSHPKGNKSNSTVRHSPSPGKLLVNVSDKGEEFLNRSESYHTQGASDVADGSTTQGGNIPPPSSNPLLQKQPPTPAGLKVTLSRSESPDDLRRGRPLSVDVTMEPGMGIYQLLQQAALRYGESHVVNHFRFRIGRSSRCYIIADLYGREASEHHRWYLKVAEHSGKVLYNDECIPNKKLISLRPGNHLFLQYRPVLTSLR